MNAQVEEVTAPAQMLMALVSRFRLDDDLGGRPGAAGTVTSKNGGDNPPVERPGGVWRKNYLYHNWAGSDVGFGWIAAQSLAARYGSFLCKVKPAQRRIFMLSGDKIVRCKDRN